MWSGRTGRETLYVKWLSPPSRRRASPLARRPDVGGPCGLPDWTRGASPGCGLTSRGQPGVSQAPALGNFGHSQYTSFLMMPIRRRPGWRTRPAPIMQLAAAATEPAGRKFVDAWIERNVRVD